MNEHPTRINLHEHEDDEKGNGLCNVIASYAACAYRKRKLMYCLLVVGVAEVTGFIVLCTRF